MRADWNEASRVVLAFGSNLGDRLENLQGAVDALFDPRGLRLVGLSPVYETAPVGGPEQDDYLNAVAVADTLLSPETLLERAQGVEEAFHRLRDVRWGPRTLDVDIIAYGGQVRTAPELTLPHPRAHERAFVLRPWADIDPGAELPGRGAVRDLLAEVADQEVRRRDDLVLRVPE
ncbi:2-amino-4-hydroxy-6-hydroxymethyldihydropteridine diphosphokinase [Thermobifida halotolerans]|uniref:2-amino-4-hydroxy-6-hydroxymethyldihydropteridine diphosphokinase n=1 Tax=Thermobifida halotolerans TaxID=483545 RepID=A0A399G1L3_9ACTN|nr:2-amino-4-hydroxy-6-hydroxymethyldihydropteridine diphosphokinase [Thermobifida halotolerans]UOE18724.1 2-amino-4-hydroxy-6-hydroxymethyldihydropteridine diphosphokinase [Thermobifida halotolerans]